MRYSCNESLPGFHSGLTSLLRAWLLLVGLSQPYRRNAFFTPSLWPLAGWAVGVFLVSRTTHPKLLGLPVARPWVPLCLMRFISLNSEAGLLLGL